METAGSKSTRAGRPHPDDETLDRIVQAVRSVRYGTVQVVIQDAKVIQIEKTEKIRLRS